MQRLMLLTHLKLYWCLNRFPNITQYFQILPNLIYFSEPNVRQACTSTNYQYINQNQYALNKMGGQWVGIKQEFSDESRNARSNKRTEHCMSCRCVEPRRQRDNRVSSDGRHEAGRITKESLPFTMSTDVRTCTFNRETRKLSAWASGEWEGISTLILNDNDSMMSAHCWFLHVIQCVGRFIFSTIKL